MAIGVHSVVRRFRKHLRALSFQKNKPRLDNAVSWEKVKTIVDLPNPEVFEHIEVVPSRDFYFHGLMFDGGPVWPYFEENGIIRHSKNGRFVDRNSETCPSVSHVNLTGDYLWGGRCFFHFGHLITEHTTRVLASVYRYPQAKIVFVLPPGAGRGDVPNYFWSVMEWFGVPFDHVYFAENAAIIERLIVFPQAEQLDQCVPANWYLDLLDLNLARSGIKPAEKDVVYVSREGQLPLGTGASAGEAELISILKRLGVDVLNPATSTLREQMELYSGAKTLIFAEGSAMHGRQLLGRLGQNIYVIRRRPNSAMAKQMLTPRCESITYVDAISDFLQPVTKNGSGLRTHGMAIYDTEVLFGFFDAVGLNVKDLWNWDKYWKHVRKDARFWLKAILERHDVDRNETLSAFSPVFDILGMSGILKEWGSDTMKR